MSKADRMTTWGIIGFGAAGSAFAEHISARPGHRVVVTDPQLSAESPPDSMRRKLDRMTVSVAPDIASLAHAGCDVIVSLVTASIAGRIAAEAAQAWQAGIYVDFNSTSPVEKRRSAGLFDDKAAYVDGAILGSIAGEGVMAPLALAGPRAEQAGRFLRAVDLRPTVISTEVGGASALKMCRSIFMKGIECLYVEMLLAARQFGVVEAVMSSVEGSFQAYTPRALADMLVTTHATHCGRRFHEMEQVVTMLEEAGMPRQMSQASAAFLQASERSDITKQLGGSTPPIRSDDVVTYLAHHYEREKQT
jgi:3-hydroxyisobutyrate dehydrogenase-like beta-hydroxyacid dehydrogenase